MKYRLKGWSYKLIFLALLLFAGGNVFGQSGAAVTGTNIGCTPTGSPASGNLIFGISGTTCGWRAMAAADVTTALGFTPLPTQNPNISGTVTITEIDGPQLVPTLTAGNWTIGTGWENPIVGPGLIKNANGTGTQQPSPSLTITPGVNYKMTVTVSSLSVGSFTVTVGGVAGAPISSNGTFTQSIQTSGAGNLIITPTNTSRFTITALTLTLLSQAQILMNQDPGDHRVTIGSGGVGQSDAGNDSVVNIGYSAGQAAADDVFSVHIGRDAGNQAGHLGGNATNAVDVGHAAGEFSFANQQAVEIGYLTRQNPTQIAGTSDSNGVFIGSSAGISMVLGLGAVVVGHDSGKNAASCFPCIMVGPNVGNGTGTLDESIFIGDTAGGSANSSGSVFIGTQAGNTWNANNKLCIDSNTTFSPAGTTCLISGDFSARLLTFNGGVISGGTKFTISGCSATTTIGGATAGTFASGTTGTCTVVINMNGATGATAPNGWACSASDRTTPANLISQSASSTTTCTITGTTVSGDVISFLATAY